MPIGDISGVDAPRPTRVRTEPIQQRSADRLNRLLDSAAEIVDEIGFDRLTTAMIAERAGAAIGTVYRYFPDRIAVLVALRERAVQRFRLRSMELMRAAGPTSVWDAVDSGITAFVELYRSEPGFRIMHFIDRERTPLSAEEAEPHLAKRLADILEEAIGITHDAELDFRLEIAVEMADAILSRAFAFDHAGDERYIEECRRVVRDYLSSELAAI